MSESPVQGSRRSRSPVSLHLHLAVLVLSVLCAGASELSLKQVAYINRGLRWTFGRVVLYQFSPDSSPLLVFRGDIPSTWSGVYFYRNLPWNRYRLVKVDTGNFGSGFVPGNMTPWAAADVDRNGFPELLAKNSEYLQDMTYLLAVLYRPPPWGPCPDSHAWRYRYDSTLAYGSEPFYITDLDRDNKADIVVYSNVRWRLWVFESAGPDSFRPVWTDILHDAHAFAFGDFDEDDRIEFATAVIGTGWVKVLKSTGDDQYVLWDSAYVGRMNGHDVFSARNLDGSNRSVLFVSFFNYMGNFRTYLYMFEPTQGTEGYEAVLIDSSVVLGSNKFASSCCADVDGDGVEELLWSCGTHVLGYRQTGPRQFERVWYWSNQDSTSANLTAYDVNGNGYNELIISGSGRTSILETEAIKVLSPNGGERFAPGDTAVIRWQTITPPRCDSVSLFLRRDTSWTLDTLVTGLSASDTTWQWQVPDTPSDSCRIVAIAYGPGWQYDASDGCFAIRSSGIGEGPTEPVFDTRLLGAYPAVTAGPTRIRFQLRERGPVELRICDIAGRTVARLATGTFEPGQHEAVWDTRGVPAGVYVVTLASDAFHDTRRLVVLR